MTQPPPEDPTPKVGATPPQDAALSPNEWQQQPAAGESQPVPGPEAHGTPGPSAPPLPPGVPTPPTPLVPPVPPAPPVGHVVPGGYPAPGPGVPPQWAWAQPVTPLVPAETEPLEYHRLYRGAPKYAWWKPLVVLVLAASIYFAMNIAFSLALVPLLAVFDPDYVNDAILQGISPVLDTQHPLSIVMGLGSVALMIPAVLLAMLALGIRPTGRVWSVAGRIRWGLLGRTLGAAVLAVLVMNGVGILLGMVMEAFAGPVSAEPLAADSPDFNVTAALASFVIVLLLVPFQAAAEEVVFRGLALQVLGSWMRSPWLAIGLSSLAFALMHIYDIWGLLAVGVMGLTAAWATWKTGGLEAAIAIHVVNNIAAFGFMSAGMSADTGQVESSGGPEALVGEVIGLALFLWLVVRIFRKHGYGRERIDTVWRPAPVAPAAPFVQGQP